MYYFLGANNLPKEIRPERVLLIQVTNQLDLINHIYFIFYGVRFLL